MVKKPKSHGTGRFRKKDFAKIGRNVVFEEGALVFHPENVEIGDNVYIGHYAVIKGYYKNRMKIGGGTWIGQHVFLHSAGGLEIGRDVGIGPHAVIITSVHKSGNKKRPVMHNELDFKPVVIGDGCDIGIGAMVLPGVKIGMNSIIGAGAVVTRDIPAYCVAAGNPAKVIKKRI
ncbi:MAG: acyltransferase [Candidatus Omnitrophota bacterium]